MMAELATASVLQHCSCSNMATAQVITTQCDIESVAGSLIECYEVNGTWSASEAFLFLPRRSIDFSEHFLNCAVTGASVAARQSRFDGSVLVQSRQCADWMVVVVTIVTLVDTGGGWHWLMTALNTPNGRLIEYDVCYLELRGRWCGKPNRYHAGAGRVFKWSGGEACVLPGGWTIS